MGRTKIISKSQHFDFDFNDNTKTAWVFFDHPFLGRVKLMIQNTGVEVKIAVVADEAVEIAVRETRFSNGGQVITVKEAD